MAIYPGARYNEEQSTNESIFLTDKTRVYVLEVAAKPNALAQFYQKRTGNKIASSVPGMIIVPINFGKASQKGDHPPLKDYVTIGGPTRAGTSVFLITNRPPDWTGLGTEGK